MDSPVAPRGSLDDEGQKLKACEENLRRYHQLALAGRLVGATMHEVNNRLAALTNLIFLVRTLSDCSLQSVEYLDEADSQLRSLGEITIRSLAFVRLDIEAKEIDLVDLATSALRLHHEQISKNRINVQTRSSESALAHVKKGEIFQAVTNILLNSIEALPPFRKSPCARRHPSVQCHHHDCGQWSWDSGVDAGDALRCLQEQQR
jgi:signal transduction histidine kinase